MKDTVSQNVFKSCADRIFYHRFCSFLFLEILLKHLPILSLTFSCSQHPYLLFFIYFFFNFRSIYQANKAIVFVQLWIVQCELRHHAVHMTKYPELSAARGIETETSMYNNNIKIMRRLFEEPLIAK